MTDQKTPSSRRTRRLATVAVLTAFTFGCTTIRQPVAVMSSAIPLKDGNASPQLALWLESAKPVTPQEAKIATARARVALEAALDGREVGDGSMILVVREQGVTRTASHKNDQAAAVAGLVLGAVVVVVGLVLWAASGAKGGGHDSAAPARGPALGHGGSAGRPTPPRVSPALPVARAVRPPPVAGLPRPSPGSPRPAPLGRPPLQGGGGPDVAVGVGVQLQPIPFEWRDDGTEVVSSRELPGPGDRVISTRELPGPGGDEAPVAGPDGDAAPAPLDALTLPPVTPLPLEERSFFAGDALVIELTLVDRISGEPRWTKWIEEDADPCDAKAVRRILDQALSEATGWETAR